MSAHVRVAAVTALNHREEWIAAYNPHRRTWESIDSRCALSVTEPVTMRPLIVIDAGPTLSNTDELVAQLQIAAKAARQRDRGEAQRVCSWLADEVERQAGPPKPDEPTGLGAVAETRDGRRWIRDHFDQDDCWFWAEHQRGGNWVRMAWHDLDVVRVLSEGVQD